MPNPSFEDTLPHNGCINSIQIANHWFNPNAATSTFSDFVGTTDNNPLQFGTNNTFPQMILNTNGNVGINFATPRNLHHLDGGTATAAYSQYTNSVTGNGASTSGLRVGVDANGDGNVFLQNNRDILFTTDGNPRMRIFRDGQPGTAD